MGRSSCLNPAADARDERHTPLSRKGELAALWREHRLGDVSEEALTIRTRFSSFDDYWSPFLEKQGPVASQLELQPGVKILDIGCGIGGTARFLASRYGCRVTGVDLTPEYVEARSSLNRRVGLSEQIELRVANAVELPFDEESFDRATLLHVGMNIPDKWKLCAEVRRVLKPGATFAVYDVMRTEDAELRYPVPWAQTAATSFVGRPDDYRCALRAAGFAITAERNRHEYALVFFRHMKARVAPTGVPPLGLHIMMGQEAATKVANMIENLERGYIAPIEMIARRA